MQILISRTLRWGVTIAGILALIGGVCFFFQHGMEPLDTEKYTTFSYTAPQNPATTTLEGIVQGSLQGQSESIIQLGVIALLLTPIMRIVLSFFDFVKQKDWLYAFITAVVLGMILANSVLE